MVENNTDKRTDGSNEYTAPVSKKYDDYRDLINDFFRWRENEVKKRPKYDKIKRDPTVLIDDHRIMDGDAFDEIGKRLGVYAWLLPEERSTIPGNTNNATTWYEVYPGESYTGLLDPDDESVSNVSTIDVDLERLDKIRDFRRKNGFDYRESWNLDFALCMDIIPRIYLQKSEHNSMEKVQYDEMLAGLVAYTTHDDLEPAYDEFIRETKPMVSEKMLITLATSSITYEKYPHYYDDCEDLRKPFIEYDPENSKMVTGRDYDEDGYSTLVYERDEIIVDSAVTLYMQYSMSLLADFLPTLWT